ncbi:MAG: hypothetical protein RSA97_02265 [Oscillospiraceae bacterium]
MKTEFNYEIKAELDISGGAASPVYADLGICMKSVSQSLNEQVYKAAYLSDDGFSSSEVIGGQLSLTFVGDKRVGDPLCDYLLSPPVLYGIGNMRKSKLKISRANKTVTWQVTLAEIAETGGAADKPCGIKLVIHGNGKPVVA